MAVMVCDVAIGEWRPVRQSDVDTMIQQLWEYRSQVDALKAALWEADGEFLDSKTGEFRKVRFNEVNALYLTEEACRAHREQEHVEILARLKANNPKPAEMDVVPFGRKFHK